MSIVLVVDDRAVNRELARVLLTYGGHQVIEAREGAEGKHSRHSPWAAVRVPGVVDGRVSRHAGWR